MFRFFMNETTLKLIFAGVILILVFMGKNENYSTSALSESPVFTARLGKIAADTEQKLPSVRTRAKVDRGRPPA